MEIIFTEHFRRRYFERIEEQQLKDKIKDAFVVPPKLAKRLKIINIPLRVIKEKKYLYAYFPAKEKGDFFCLQIRDKKIIVKTVFPIEGIAQEVMDKCLKDNKRVKEII